LWTVPRTGRAGSTMGRIHSRSHGSPGIRDGCEWLRADGGKCRLRGRRTAEKFTRPL